MSIYRSGKGLQALFELGICDFLYFDFTTKNHFFYFGFVTKKLIFMFGFITKNHFFYFGFVTKKLIFMFGFITKKYYLCRLNHINNNVLQKNNITIVFVGGKSQT